MSKPKANMGQEATITKHLARDIIVPQQRLSEQDLDVSLLWSAKVKCPYCGCFTWVIVDKAEYEHHLAQPDRPLSETMPSLDRASREIIATRVCSACYRLGKLLPSPMFSR